MYQQRQPCIETLHLILKCRLYLNVIYILVNIWISLPRINIVVHVNIDIIVKNKLKFNVIFPHTCLYLIIKLTRKGEEPLAHLSKVIGSVHYMDISCDLCCTTIPRATEELTSSHQSRSARISHPNSE